MTNEEAKNEIIEMRNFALMRGSYYGEIAIPTYNAAIEALEKQIPKDVNKYGFMAAGTCVCGAYVNSADHYCSKCGQALKWG